MEDWQLLARDLDGAGGVELHDEARARDRVAHLVAIAHDATARDAPKEGARGASAARARATALVANPEDAVA